MSLIHQIAAASSAAVDVVHGEAVVLRPMTGNQHSGFRPDASRTERTIKAPLLIGSALEQLDSRQRTDAEKYGAGAAVLYVAREVWPEDFGLKKGDHVVATERPGQPVFRVEHVDPRPRTRILVHLSGN